MKNLETVLRATFIDGSVCKSFCKFSPDVIPFRLDVLHMTVVVTKNHDLDVKT